MDMPSTPENKAPAPDGGARRMRPRQPAGSTSGRNAEPANVQANTGRRAGPIKTPPVAAVFGLLLRILGPEKDFFILAVVYGIGISLLSLALPISVQMLINTVANTGLITPLAVLSATLFILLLVSGLLNALRIHLMELFGRRFYARMVSEISLRTVYAQNPFFHDAKKGALFNRYFDVVIVQKSIPYLLVGGFTILLQALVGFVVVSLYHPLFLAFNIVTIVIIWLVIAIFGPGAISAGIALSHRKHNAAAWLEGLGGSNGFFQTERHIEYALDETDAATGAYVDEHKRFFRRSFTQTILLLIIYAAASAALLGLGGWLVIQGQLSLGQLVAAELILSAVFAGIAQLGGYLTAFYDLCAATEELSLFYDVEQEEPKPSNNRISDHADVSLRFDRVTGDARGQRVELTFDIPSGATVMACASNHGLQRLVSTLLKRHVAPESGVIQFGRADILGVDVHSLRQQIKIIDRPTMNEMTIRDYLRLSARDASPAQLTDMLDTVGLKDTLAILPGGLDVRLAATGWPLSVTEVMQLKLAAALLARPRLLILNQLMDLLPENCLAAAVAKMRAEDAMTVIYFTNRNRSLGFDYNLTLSPDAQTITPADPASETLNPASIAATDGNAVHTPEAHHATTINA